MIVVFIILCVVFLTLLGCIWRSDDLSNILIKTFVLGLAFFGDYIILNGHIFGS